MTSDYMWVVAFDEITNKQKGFVRCHKNNANYYIESYADKGYNTRLFTSEELDEMIESKRSNSRKSE